MKTEGSVAASDVSFESVAHELYGLPLARFVTRRDELARRARAAGDRELADRVGALRRPTLVVWLANQLVREHPEEVQPLLALGEALREATEQLRGEQLRELARQQRTVLAAMVTQARAIGNAAGQKVSEDAARGLEDTLRAALADPDAADALAGGRLTAGLTPPAFGGLAGPSLGVVPPLADARSDRRHGGVDRRLVQARADAAAAEAQADRMSAALQDASTEVALADERVGAAEEQVRDLQGRLEAATRAHAAAAEAARDAHAALDRADRASRDAERRLRQARARVESLEPAAAREGAG